MTVKNTLKSLKSFTRGKTIVETIPIDVTPYVHEFDPPMPLAAKLIFLIIPLVCIVLSFIAGNALAPKHPPPAVIVPVSLTPSSTPSITPTPTITGTPRPTGTPTPSPTGAPITATPGSPVIVSTSNYPCVYTVAPGDTLFAVSYRMAKLYNVQISIGRLAQLNNITNLNSLKVGQSLLVCDHQ